MNDPQVWTLIAVMGALFFAVLRTQHTVVKAIDERLGERIDGVESRLGARIDGVEAKLTTEVARLDAKIDERADRLTELMNARFTDVDHRLSSVEDDMRLVKAHLIGQRSA